MAEVQDGRLEALVGCELEVVSGGALGLGPLEGGRLFAHHGSGERPGQERWLGTRLQGEAVVGVQALQPVVVYRPQAQEVFPVRQVRAAHPGLRRNCIQQQGIEARAGREAARGRRRRPAEAGTRSGWVLARAPWAVPRHRAPSATAPGAMAARPPAQPCRSSPARGASCRPRLRPPHPPAPRRGRPVRLSRR